MLFSVKIKNMEDVNAVFRQFKRSSENCHLNIEYGLIECYKHSTEMITVYLNYNDNKSIDVMNEKEKFENIVEDVLFKNLSIRLVHHSKRY